MIQQRIATNRTPNFIIVTEETVKWLPKLLEGIPPPKNPSMLAPSSYKCPNFLQKPI